MRTIIRAASLCIALSAPPTFAAVAQTQPTDDIVVVGDKEQNVQRQVNSYVRELGVAAGDIQAARWFAPVCPRALGLSKDHAALVEQQIRQVARTVGTRLAGEGCTPNLAVIFTEDGGELVRNINKADTRRMRELSPSTFRQLSTGEAPIRWWYNVRPQSRHGVPEAPDVGPVASILCVCDTSFPTNGSRTVNAHPGSSAVSSQVVRAIHSATVVVDVNRSHGFLLRSIVDYAALVGLAEIKLGASPPNSILSMFEPERAHDALTSRDTAFLTSLYKIPMDRSPRQQRHSLIGAVANLELSSGDRAQQEK